MRVLLIFPGALGDLLLLAPAATAAAADGAQVEMSVQRAYLGLARLILPGAQAPPVDGMVMSSLFAAQPSPALADWLSGADCIHAWLGTCVDRRAIERTVRALGVGRMHWHEVERGDEVTHASAAYASALALAILPPMPSLELPDTQPPYRWRSPRPARLVIHPGAGAVAKRWSRLGFAAVADGWRAGGGEAAILLGPAEHDQDAFWQATGHAVVGHLDILEAAALLASASRYLGNDSGVSHLAGALGLAGATLFGPTRPERWRPLGGHLQPFRFDGADADGPLVTALLDRLRQLGTPLP